MAEWLKATDCKSVLVRVRRFETYSAHIASLLYAKWKYGSSFKCWFFQFRIQIVLAEVAHLVER